MLSCGISHQTFALNRDVLIVSPFGSPAKRAGRDVQTAPHAPQNVRAAEVDGFQVLVG